MSTVWWIELSPSLRRRKYFFEEIFDFDVEIQEKNIFFLLLLLLFPDKFLRIVDLLDSDCFSVSICGLVNDLRLHISIKQLTGAISWRHLSFCYCASAEARLHATETKCCATHRDLERSLKRARRAAISRYLNGKSYHFNEVNDAKRSIELSLICKVLGDESCLLSFVFCEKSSGCSSWTKTLECSSLAFVQANQWWILGGEAVRRHSWTRKARGHSRLPTWRKIPQQVDGWLFERFEISVRRLLPDAWPVWAAADSFHVRSEWHWVYAPQWGSLPVPARNANDGALQKKCPQRCLLGRRTDNWVKKPWLVEGRLSWADWADCDRF